MEQHVVAGAPTNWPARQFRSSRETCLGVFVYGKSVGSMARGLHGLPTFASFTAPFELRSTSLPFPSLLIQSYHPPIGIRRRQNI